MKKVDFLIKVRGDPLASHTILCRPLVFRGLCGRNKWTKGISGRNEEYFNSDSKNYDIR